MNDRSKVLDCESIAAELVLERYVAGTLPAEETRTLEEHLIDCERCQRELALGVAVRDAFGVPAAGGSESDGEGHRIAPGRRGRRRGWIGAAGAGLAAAAVAAFLLFRPSALSRELATLGGVSQPPVYLGIPVRAEPAPWETAFGEAMARYAEADFRAAAAGLEQAIQAGVPPVPAEFFRGASLLMLDRPAAASEALAAVISAGGSPYLAEAHFYRAKALLRLGRGEDALVELRAAASEGGEIGAAAAALADSVEAVVGG